ncbi:von Willebrand factor C and EGF domain-containing protein-like isoform X2 [Chiloscyllium plagiosum]|uniref:von Willebrand factor C and EGF domain-containing protein-like isoform X2 n=1 Tax=Chiloscyllium plagiosum TaxID=36176 RepID=UPI001CB87F91|nr:von Willebrand factor C and EGF domain-containing protein-like isoform X2 [Chiloscyllium plagiosum]
MIGLKTLCVLLCVLGADGRVYTGRKRGVQKNYSTAMQRYRQGPHMCQSRFGNGCCLGWNPTRGSGLCIIPVCSFGCGNGYCIAPNLCFCRGGQQSNSCSDDGRSSHLLSDSLLNHSDIDGNPPSCLNMHCDQSCALIGGMPVCSCYGGYSLGKDGKTCFDVDECSRYGGQSLCQQICKNSIGSYRCLCYQGYQLLANGRTCITSKYLGLTGLPGHCGEYGCDMSCNHGGCEEISRVCPVGFTMIETSNGVSCKDVDECAGNRSPCQQRCQNVVGSFQCSCQPGFYLHSNGLSCTDINECRWIGESRVCHHSCHNTFGSYLCSCRAGFRLLSDRKTCEDWDECLDNSQRICPQTCTNTVGSFHCSCENGYSLGADNLSCADVDECEIHGHTLCEHQCMNTVGSFNCICPPGYELLSDGQRCGDVNECEKSNCSHHCVNTLGSFQCLCPRGYTQHVNGHNCQDNNECGTSGDGHCAHNCVNTAGSYYCTCHPGYRLHFDRHTCISDGACQDCQGECSPGFSLLPNGVDCTDIDECLSNPCSHHCVNTEGSFYCTCPEGFHLNMNNTCTENVPDLAPAMKSLKQPLPAAIFATPWKPLTSCWHNGTLHQDSATWIVSECVKCTCQLGAVSCTTCPTLPCSKVELVPGLCCPICKSCLYNGSVHTHNSSWVSVSQPCLTCSCQEGQVFCQPIVCESSCSHQVREEGQCCGTCDKCLYEGMVVNHEDVFSPTSDNCTLCVCISGNVKCITPECPPVTCEKPILLDCCPTCPAECIDQGIVYPHGTEFTRPGVDCITCVCLNGEVECSYSPCPVLHCARENWFLEPGQCCFTCRQDKNIKGCFIDDNGIEFPVGQIWSPGDPCEVCVCQEDGSIVCKRTECLETCAHPILVPGQCCPDCSAGCTYGGVTYQNNESFPSTSDSCLTCICLSGSVACSPMECKVRCTYPFHSEGECCPLCIDCNYEGRKVTNGQSFQPENRPCYQCKCQFGEVSCDILMCEPPSCENPYSMPGECCPTCSVCLYDGQVLEDGGYYISATDPCVVCLCKEGNVECDWKGDSCTELECEEPLLHIPGSCCPMCPDLSTESSVLYPPITDNMIPEKPAPTRFSRGHWRATVQLHPSGLDGRLLSVSPSASPTARQHTLHRILLWSVRSKLAQGFTASPERSEIVTTQQPVVGHTTEMDRSTGSMDQGHSVTQTELPSPTMAKTTSLNASSFQGCLFNGVNYTNGSQFIHRDEPCLQCQCSEGTVMCKSQKGQCQVLQCDLLQQETPVGQCCPVCVDSLCAHQDQVHEDQTHWLDGCNLCHCNNGTLECHPKPCSPPSSCPAQSVLSQPDGECCMSCVPTTRPKGTSCTVFGELHFTTFDGIISNLNGTCAYLLAQDCVSNHFNVVYQSKWNDSLTEPGIKVLIIKIENRTIQLTEKNQIRINNTEVDLPYADAAGISIQHSGIYVTLNLLEDLSITWYGKGFVEINVPESLQSRMCGLCGNWNGNSSDDFVLPSGEKALSPVGFGNVQPIRVNKERLCMTEDTEDPCNGTILADKHAANTTCSIIMGPLFQAAHESVDPQPYYQACLTDLCSCVEQTWCLCNLLSAYAFRALRNGIILNWRNETLCGVTCNGGSSYTECSCPQTCSTYLQPETQCSTSTCVPGCQCPAGLFMYQSNCLPPSLCPMKSLYSQREASFFPSL